MSGWMIGLEIAALCSACTLAEWIAKPINHTLWMNAEGLPNDKNEGRVQPILKNPFIWGASTVACLGISSIPNAPKELFIILALCTGIGTATTGLTAFFSNNSNNQDR